MEKVKRRIETMLREEWALLKSSGMMWEIYPNAPDVYDEKGHVKCKCTGTFNSVCSGACADNTRGGSSS